MSARMQRIVRDPLFVFCLLGAGCFLLFAALAEEKEVIVVSDALREQLADDFRVIQGRPPHAEELEALLQRHLGDEVLFREALARGLHLGDARIRMMLIEKMRFLLADPPEEPTDEELVAHYLENMDRYVREARYSLRNIFFQTRPEDPDALLAELENGAEIDGDPGFWLGSRLVDYHASVVRNVIGPEALRKIESMSPGDWVGPVESPRGYHFLRLDGRVPERPLPFAEVSERVREDWAQARRDASIEQRLDGLRAGYAIRQR